MELSLCGFHSFTFFDEDFFIKTVVNNPATRQLVTLGPVMGTAMRRRKGRSPRPGYGNGKGTPVAPRTTAAAVGVGMLGRYRLVPGWAPNPLTVFGGLVVVRIAAALLSPIADCDETYNYWEPMHYLLFRFGFQTWEYSPQFALRSYAFLYPYAAFARASMFAMQTYGGAEIAGQIAKLKISAFYGVRIVQAVLCAATETYLYDAALWRFGKPVARVLFPLLASSPGMFRASAELLPSSFAMIVLTAAFSAWMLGDFVIAVALVAVASLFGWIYVAAMAVPMAIHIIYRRGLLSFSRYAVTSGLIVFLFTAPIDTHHFGQPVFVPLNHIIYNVFPKEGSGPDLFGVEHWIFYVVNLILNCNVAAVLLASFPLLWLVDGFRGSVWGSRQKDRVSRLIFLSPCFVWLLVFMNQPHKEERFLAPCYPPIALIASVALADWLQLLANLFGLSGTSTPAAESAGGKKRSFALASLLKAAVSLIAVTLACALGISRIVMQIKSYSAPLQLYHNLAVDELRNGLGPRNAPAEFESPDKELNICVGSEWYRFPGNFFMPHRRFRVRFIRDGFSGLLPKYYAEQEHGTRVAPPGMNMFNKEDPEQYFDWADTSDGAGGKRGCHYMITLDLSHRNANSSNSDDDSVPIPRKAQLVLRSLRFLDTEKSPAGLRAFHIPGYEERLVYGHYKLIRNLQLLPIVR